MGVNVVAGITGSGTFNTPLEMPGDQPKGSEPEEIRMSFNTPLEMQRRAVRRQARRGFCFQYSVGDAPYTSATQTETCAAGLSILRWRCRRALPRCRW